MLRTPPLPGAFNDKRGPLDSRRPPLAAFALIALAGAFLTTEARVSHAQDGWLDEAFGEPSITRRPETEPPPSRPSLEQNDRPATTANPDYLPPMTAPKLVRQARSVAGHDGGEFGSLDAATR